ncbi:MAG: hypothetical protein OQJ97_15800 [Rhodospirillales bacterium]|nr:hypothetical protein [Rhodospirillales bacterium]
MGPEPSINGGSGTDNVTLTTTISNSIDLGAGIDSLQLADGGNTLGILNIESITGGSGNDDLTARSLFVGSESIDLGGGTDILTLFDGANTVSVMNTETVIGGTGNDHITANFTQAVSFDGGLGNDILYGAAGADTITGGNGADSIYSANGDDYISGGTGNDYIEGGAGNDTITGGAGKDTLSGGAGNDIFDYSLVDLTGTAPNADVISDFNSTGVDKIRVQGITGVNVGTLNTLLVSDFGVTSDIVSFAGGNSGAMFVYQNNSPGTDDILYFASDASNSSSYQAVASFSNDTVLSASDITVILGAA